MEAKFEVNNQSGNANSSATQIKRLNWADIKDVVGGVKPIKHFK